jgi:Ca-activated chloride channel family protein
MKSRVIFTVIAIAALAIPSHIFSQSGRTGTGIHKTTLNLIVNFPASTDGTEGAKQVGRDDLSLFDAGVPQTIETVTPDRSPARVALLVDTTSSLKLDANAIGPLAHKMVSELYGDDLAMIVSFAESAEVVQPFTADANKLKMATAGFQKKGLPRLFDAISATIDDALQKEIGSGKRAIILITDGYDRDSTLKFEDILSLLQDDNIVVYVVQLPDRTLGASRRTGPKPTEAIKLLTEGTGGKIYSYQDADRAAKEIAEELRHGWYQLTYSPAGVTSQKMRRLLVTVYESKYKVRTKSMIP